MILTVDLTASEPIYQQIRNQVVRAVATGELCTGDTLPSVRSLATDLGVNMHTVNKAYAVLRDEGYVVMQRRSGAVIADRGAARSADAQRQDRQRLAATLHQLALEHKAQGGSLDEFVLLATSQATEAFGATGVASQKEGTR